MRGVRLDLVGSRNMLLVEDAELQPVVETTGSVRVNAPESHKVAGLPRNSKQCQPARCSLSGTALNNLYSKVRKTYWINRVTCSVWRHLRLSKR